MGICRILFTIWMLVFCFACETESVVEKKESPESIAIHLLIFKKENKLELQISDSKKYIEKSTFQITDIQQLPLGLFPLSFDNDSLHANFKVNKLLRSNRGLKNNDFSDLKINLLSLVSKENAKELTEILQPNKTINLAVFPNDISTDGSLEPCMNCPVWMPEVYAGLEMLSLKFKSQ